MLSLLQIVNKLGLEDSDPEVQNKILQDLANAVATRIFLRVSEKLNDSEIDELAKLVDADDEAGMESYVSSKIPDFDKFKIKIEEELIEEMASKSLDIEERVSALRDEKLQAFRKEKSKSV